MSSVPLIEWLQSFSTPQLDTAFITITRLGDETFYLLALPALYWSVQHAVGFRLGLLFITSILINAYIKEFFQLPRPWQVHESIRSIRADASFGFPSGHAQGTTTFWGFLIASFRSRALTAAGCAVVLAVALSRLYLGQHYVADVLGGIAIGAALVLLVALAPFPAAFRPATWNLPAQLLGRLAISLAPLLLSRGELAYKLCGYLLGFLAGAALERRWVRMDPAATIARQTVRIVLGLTILFALQLVTRPFFPDGGPQVIRYAVFGAWVSCAAPYLFVRLGLSRSVLAPELTTSIAGRRPAP